MKRMNYGFLKYFFSALVYSSVMFAEEKIRVDINSDKVLLEEQVIATIRVETDSDQEPKINVDSVNAEIVSSNYQGVSASSVYANGELTTKKEFIYSVLLQPKSLGRAALTNITADIGGRVLKHESVWFSCVKMREEAPPVFILAVPSKTQVYQNEGILLRYYLMTQVDIASFDIKEFPKLNNFIKRYLQESASRERVAYEGKQFIRQQLYSLVLFPEKSKTLLIDSMRIQVSYDQDGNRDPFGFGGGRLVSKVISSKPIDIEVLNVPADKTPTGYTGLVGKHKFSLSVNKTKVLTNEPVEIKLKIIGTGNLEGADAPTIINDPAFETFDTNSALEIIDAANASKTFEYTYLPRRATKIPAQKIPLSFFNPESQQYETVEVDFPGIEVVGGVYQQEQAATSSTEEKSKETSVIAENSIKKPTIVLPRYSPPIYGPSVVSANLYRIGNFILLFFALALLVKLFLDNKELLLKIDSSIYRHKLKKIATNGISYSAMEDLLLPFPSLDSNVSLVAKVKQLNLPPESKVRLESLLENFNQRFAKNSGAAENQNVVDPLKTWKTYRSDLCMLVQSLESWEKNKKENNDESL